MSANVHPDTFNFEAIRWRIESYVLSIVLNRPDKRNAINTAMARELVYLVAFAKNSESVRVVKISAEGQVFSAGGDLAAMRGDEQISKSTVPSLAQNTGTEKASNADLNLIASTFRELHKPSLVVVEGPVFAGALLIICNATHVYAREDAVFGAPEIKRGLWPYMVMAGLFRTIPRRVGLDWILTGESISADTAASWGLINESLSTDCLAERVDAKVEQLRTLPPKTVSLGLEAYNNQEEMAFAEALPYLAGMLQKTIDEGDAQEGIAAFLEKRPPKWLSK